MQLTYSGLAMPPRPKQERHDWLEIHVPTHPIDGGRWVAVTEIIRNNETGETREHYGHSPLDDVELHPSTFIWEDGNYSCDCNRRLFFGYDNDEDESDAEIQCSDGLFSVNLKNPVTGEVFYREFDDAVATQAKEQ